ncbi:MAG: YhjD/YihY/BrkB family envelope integrity protein [Acidobacteriota bacterium]
MRKALAGLLGFAARLVQAQHRDQLLLRSAALAYTTLLSLVPLLTVALVTVGRVQPERADLVVRAIATVLPFSPARVQATLTAFAERTASLGWWAILVSALVTLQAFYQIEEVINAVWGVPRRRWQWRLASLLAVLAWGPLLLAALFSFLYWVSSRPFYRSLAPFSRPLPALLALVVLTALYRWVPHTRVPWRAAFTGAAVAAAALVAVHLGFQAYLAAFADLNVIYGSLTLVLFFLVSLLLFWFAVLLGVEASWVVGHAPAPPTRQRLGDIVTLLLEALRDGNVAPERATTFLGDEAEVVLAHLTAAPEILRRSEAGWQLARRPEEIPLDELHTRLGCPAPVTPDAAEPATLATLAKSVPGITLLSNPPDKPSP